ncbi:thioredoxin family protein [Marixanthomonas ophiurae]|uniref:DUF255 domain-containing protein n=1 Tax=Marixanthomonas ophiurae TaxID=387659 RepID=A0A3E1QAB0_9FLAO|nr:thioredoxin fold domain-containing protein [Marixanthomonas ophiurae]RFN59072.1 DUF255 domain-containing protein [Marixanthomonas ophiurae]
MKQSLFLITLLVLLFSSEEIKAQKTEAINWVTFEQLNDSLSVKPKKVVLFFYADWCVYCKKMEQAAFKKPEIIQKINSGFYAVKFNTETTQAVVFDGVIFNNTEAKTKRNPVHDIATLFASREEVPFSLPATIFLDKDFAVTHRVFEYISPKKMMELLNN